MLYRKSKVRIKYGLYSIQCLLICFIGHNSFSQLTSIGKYSVGYKSEIIKDTTNWDEKIQRSFPLHIWYPSCQKPSQSSLKFTDYLEADSNPSWGHLNSSTVLKNLVSIYADSSQIGEILNYLILNKTLAHKGIKPIKSDFPVVILTNGLNSPGFIQSQLAEYLASHGFVVLCYPIVSKNIKNPLDFNQESLNGQIYDLELVINVAKKNVSF